MKRLLVVLALVGVMVAALGFANTFAINEDQPNDEDISAAGTLVDSCSSNVALNPNGAFNDENSRYEISTVYVNVNPPCPGWTVEVTLTSEAGASLGSASTTVDADTEVELDFSDQHIAVADVFDIHAQLDENPADGTSDPN